jgi:uncharacterized damage-inducible protein DinB
VTVKTLATLGVTRAQTLAALAPLSQAQFDFSPGTGRWSIGEIAHHLVLAESLYREEIARLVALARAGQRPYLKRTFDDVNVAPLHLPVPVLSLMSVPLGIMSRFMPEIVRSVVTEFPLLPTRNPDRATPGRGLASAELRHALETGLEETRALMTANEDLDFPSMISEHPLTGPSTVPQILGFLALHERRHQGQMARVRSDPRFPPA